MNAEIITTCNGSIGHILLNRPKALNALTLPMIQGIHAALEEWRHDPKMLAVVIEGAGDRAFSSGGDLRTIYGAKENAAFGAEIFAAEYQLNYKIHTYPKPYIAILDGICMGGGAGVSIFGSHRIVTEFTRFAMPECGIGLFPDIGASWFLQKAPGMIGLYLGLTGETLGAADAIYIGVGTDYIPRASIPEFIQELSNIKNIANIDGIIRGFESNAGAPTLPSIRDNIDHHFSAGSILEIWQKLDESDWGQHIKHVMQRHSPTSLAIAFEAFKRARSMGLKEILEMDFVLSQSCLRGHDFYEGVRALVIDKDKNPNWKPATIQSIDLQQILACFSTDHGNKILKNVA